MFFRSVVIRLGFLCLIVFFWSSLVGQALHTNMPCDPGNAMTSMQFQQGGFLDWDVPGNLVQTFNDVGRPGQSVTYTISGNTGALINSPGNGLATPNVDFFSNTYTDAISLMTSGIGNGEKIEVLVEYNPPIPGNLGFEVYHINQSGSGDRVKVTSLTTQGTTLNPTFTTPVGPDYQILGQNTVNAINFTTLDKGQLGVNFSSPDSIVSTLVEWKDCSGCPAADHGLGIGDFNFCRLFLDNDKDGVEDHIDVDDDNDGILDVTETCNVMLENPDQDTIQIEIVLDGYPDETTWELLDDLGNVLAAGGPYFNPADIGVTIQAEVILGADQNTNFLIYDSFGDALTSSPAGSYKISRNGNVEVGPITSNWGYTSNENITALGGPFDPFACIGTDYAYDDDDDGLFNYQDPDFCTLNAYGVCFSLDEDGDGVIDAFDQDADNDGIPDAIEAQGAACYIAPSSTVNSEGLPINMDGYINCNDVSSSSTYGVVPNIDGDDPDGLPDYKDLDTDADGIADYAEGFDFNGNLQAVDDYLTMAAAFSPSGGSLGSYPGLDSDGDLIPDWLDNLPASPGFDQQLLPPFQDPNTPFFFDYDRDGIVDLFDPDQGGSIPAYPPDYDLNNDPDWRDIDNNTSLPVVFAGFDIFWSREVNVTLKWATIDEIGLSHFEIERSRDGIQFSTIEWVEPTGQSQNLNRYELTDYEIGRQVEDFVYYRLKAIDLDGNATYSEIEKLALGEKGERLELEVFPNPSEGMVTIRINDREEVGNLSIINIHGKTVWSEGVRFTQGGEVKRNLSFLPSGVYMVILKTDQYKDSMKLILR